MQTHFNYDHYFLQAEIEEKLNYFESNYPNLFKKEVLMTTEKGLNQYAVTLTNFKIGNDLNKPGFYMDGNIHAGEVTACMACMYTIDAFLTNYGKDEKVTKLLDEKAFYIIPRVSPDGAEKYLSSPYFMYSADRDWLEEKGGMKEEDIDGDGFVYMMRIKNKYGSFKKDPNDPDLMIPRLPDDTDGQYYSVFREGYLEKGKDLVNLKNAKMHWGMNFNRNLPFGWYPDYREPGAGDYPLSFPEVKAQAEFIMNHKNIGGVAAMHTTAGQILYPPGTYSEAKANREDMKLFKSIGAMGTAETGYPCLNVFDSFLADQENYSSGALDDWCYETQGMLAYTVELWDLAHRVGIDEDMTERITGDENKKIERFVAYCKWVKENCPQYYKSWTKFSHPQFGEVEIGGYNYKFVQQNPPGKYLNEVCDGQARFILRFASSLPQIEIISFKAREVGINIYKVEAIIANRGYLPTYISNKAIETKAYKPLQIDLEGGEILEGEKHQEIIGLDGFGNAKNEVFYGMLLNTDEGNIKKYFSWIVKINKPAQLKLNIKQEKSGFDQKTINL